jgi:hypothetical protein
VSDLFRQIVLAQNDHIAMATELGRTRLGLINCTLREQYADIYIVLVRWTQQFWQLHKVNGYLRVVTR